MAKLPSGAVAALGLAASVVAVVCCAVCVIATGLGADLLAVVAGGVGAAALAATMLSLELDGTEPRPDLASIAGVARGEAY